jgi:hypothetical protein
MSTIPQDLNWVEKRASCSATQLFYELRNGINNDIAVFNLFKKLPSDQQFAADMTSDGTTICVGQHGIQVRPIVYVGFAENKIVVRDMVKQLNWSAEAKLNQEGRCILRLEDGTELEQWQFRKKALEGLFFGD